MDLNAVKMFVAVVQAGNLSKASVRLNVPIATLSRHIATLENDLQTQLLERLKSGVKPTLAGTQLYEQSQSHIHELLQVERDFGGLSGQLSGILRIAAPPSFVPALDCIAQFGKQHPNVTIHTDWGEKMSDLLADDVDVAFRIGELKDDRLIVKKLMDIHTKLVASPALIARLGTPDTIAELANFPCATWARHFEQLSPWVFGDSQKDKHKQSYDGAYQYSSNDLFALNYLAVSGAAIAMLPEYYIKDTLTTGQLVELLPDVPRANYPVHLVYVARRYPSALVRAFVAFCLKNYHANPL